MLRFGATLFLLGSLAMPLSASEVALEKRLLLGGKVEMLVPTTFQPMPEEILKLKYPSERRPTFVLSNERASVSLALNHTQNRVPQAELADAHRAVDKMFRNLYPSAEWFQSELTELNGRQFLIMELRTPAVDTEIRNIMVGTSLDDRLLLVSVNMTKALEETWLEVAHRMIRSIVIKK